MNTQHDGQKKLTLKAFIFRVMIVIILEIVLLYFGDVSLLIHLIIFLITLFTTSVLACVVFLSEEEIKKVFGGEITVKEKKAK